MRAHAKYLSYVVRHKWFVFLAGLKTGAPIWRLIIHDWSKFTPGEWFPYVRKFNTPIQPGERIGGVCDNSPFDGVVLKTRPATDHRRPGLVDCFLQSEGWSRPSWVWSFEVQERCEVDAAFDRAWLHHQHANPHHWQHWTLREDSGAVKLLPMPQHFAWEMVADWMGAGRAITGRWEVAEWYARNRSLIQLHPETRALVENLLAVAPRGKPAAA